MDLVSLRLCAYHESARVVYAYQCGYHCESIKLSDSDPGGGISTLNAGKDNDTIKSIINNNAQSTNTRVTSNMVDIAKNLMKIYCAGPSAENFLKNNKQIINETEIKISGQDIKYINLVQSFLENNVVGHPPDYPAQIVSQILLEFTKTENWKIIEVLAQTALKNEEKNISRFYVEDALMKAGFKPARPQSIQPIEMQITEDKTSKAPIHSPGQVPEKEKVINDALKKFLRSIKKELNDEEIAASVDYIKTLFKNNN